MPQARQDSEASGMQVFMRFVGGPCHEQMVAGDTDGHDLAGLCYRESEGGMVGKQVSVPLEDHPQHQVAYQLTTCIQIGAAVILHGQYCNP